MLAVDQDFAEDPHLPPLRREWDRDLPQTGRQYLRQVRREAAQNYIPARPLITKQWVQPSDYIPVELRDSAGDSEEVPSQAGSGRRDAPPRARAGAAGDARARGDGNEMQAGLSDRAVDVTSTRAADAPQSADGCVLESATQNVALDEGGICGGRGMMMEEGDTGSVRRDRELRVPKEMTAGDEDGERAGVEKPGAEEKALQWARNYSRRLSVF